MDFGWKLVQAGHRVDPEDNTAILGHQPWANASIIQYIGVAVDNLAWKKASEHALSLARDCHH